MNVAYCGARGDPTNVQSINKCWGNDCSDGRACGLLVQVTSFSSARKYNEVKLEYTYAIILPEAEQT